MKNNLEEVISSQDVISEELRSEHKAEKRQIANIKKETQALIKQHYTKLIKDKDMAIKSLKSAVSQLS